MPGSFKKNTALGAVPRPIHSDLKSKRIVWETEHPVRWSFMKILRETSSLKQFYPEINPYTEVYQVREGVYALYNDSFDGAGDVWMYLVDGPEKALLVDTSFGVGDLKGLIRHLIGDKELIVVNTHAHYDHCYGNAQFERVYCHRNEVLDLQTKNNPDIWDYLFNNTDQPIQVWDEWIQPGEPVYTHFDKEDIIIDCHHKENYVPYEIIGIEDGHLFDLGDGYLVKLSCFRDILRDNVVSMIIIITFCSAAIQRESAAVRRVRLTVSSALLKRWARLCGSYSRGLRKSMVFSQDMALGINPH